MPPNGRSGLARALSKMGYCSRSQATELIRAGRVSVNGSPVRNPEKPVRPRTDHISVDGSTIAEQPKIYLMMNKPRGLVTTRVDEGNRSTVYDLLDSIQAEKWVSPVGRLDKASEGLLLLTNDSKWAARITDPLTHLNKRYHVQVDCVATDGLLRDIRVGAKVGTDLLMVKDVQILRVGHKNSWLEITLDEGKNRQIRRLLEALDVQVLRLVRARLDAGREG